MYKYYLFHVELLGNNTCISISFESRAPNGFRLLTVNGRKLLDFYTRNSRVS